MYHVFYFLPIKVVVLKMYRYLHKNITYNYIISVSQRVYFDDVRDRNRIKKNYLV